MEGSQYDQHTFKLSPKLYEEAGRHNLSTLRGPSDKPDSRVLKHWQVIQRGPAQANELQ